MDLCHIKPFIKGTFKAEGHFSTGRIVFSVCVLLVSVSSLFPPAPMAAVYLLTYGTRLCSAIVDEFNGKLNQFKLPKIRKGVVKANADEEMVYEDDEDDQVLKKLKALRSNLETTLDDGNRVAGLLEEATKVFGLLAFDEIAASLLFG
jgi:hypothetical protein